MRIKAEVSIRGSMYIIEGKNADEVKKAIAELENREVEVTAPYHQETKKIDH